MDSRVWDGAGMIPQGEVTGLLWRCCTGNIWTLINKCDQQQLQSQSSVLAGSREREKPQSQRNPGSRAESGNQGMGWVERDLEVY